MPLKSYTPTDIENLLQPPDLRLYYVINMHSDDVTQ